MKRTLFMYWNDCNLNVELGRIWILSKQNLYEDNKTIFERYIGPIWYAMRWDQWDEIKHLHDELQDQVDFPGAFGFVDGSLIALAAVSHLIEHAHVSRKSFHAINAQFVCDIRMRFLSVNARYPGSTHDALIWRDRNKTGGTICWLTMDTLCNRGCWSHTILRTPQLKNNTTVDIESYGRWSREQSACSRHDLDAYCRSGNYVMTHWWLAT